MSRLAADFVVARLRIGTLEGWLAQVPASAAAALVLRRRRKE
jgi:hypothetical protein